MNTPKNFKRFELKYLITTENYERILELMKDKMIADIHGKSTICNIYFDTPDYLLIRRSLDKPVYKEKLRLRSYGLPNDDTTVFLELKKKYYKIVYKRRECLKYKDALEFIKNHEPFSQVTREIAYFMDLYQGIKPAIFISYDREAFYSIDDKNLRITFDTNIMGRNENVSFDEGIYGHTILKEGMILMEIKAIKALPLWLCDFLTEEHIFRKSFSKYGDLYKYLKSIKN